MSNRIKQLKHTQYLSVGLIFLLLLAATPVAAQTLGSGGGHSGDDAYDPAAGGTPEVSMAAAPGRVIRRVAKTFSGDDAYDPAAGGLPTLSLVAVPQQSTRSGAATFSGDDAYDPAAGGLPTLHVVGLARSSGSEIACAPLAGELEARSGGSVVGGFSGDDAYDPAAGGTPELSLLTIGLDLAACGTAASGN